MKTVQTHTSNGTAIRRAYALLAVISIGILVLDNHRRTDEPNGASFSPASNSAHSVPFPITPLADSPFLSKFSPSNVAVASPLPETQKERKQRSATQGGNPG